MMWLMTAVVLLYFMKESISIYNPADPSIKYSILSLMALPYTVTRDYSSESNPYISAFQSNREEEIEMVGTSPSGIMCSSHHTSSLAVAPQQYEGSASSPKAIRMTIQRNDTASAPRGSNCVTIRITMPSNFGWRSWRWYEAVIETIAVGVYLYATFVLTSLLFLNADKAIGYATVMALCLSMVRILTVLF